MNGGKTRRAGVAAALGAAAVLAVAGCGDDDEATEQTAAAFTSQDVLGFEALDAWTPGSGTEAASTMHTQGALAYALTAPVGFTPIVSAAIDSATPNLQGLTAAGSSLAVDFVLPTAQPNPSFFGALQASVNAPSRSVFNQFLSQVDLTGLPRGSFQTLRFTVPDSLRNSLRGATFTDLTFTLSLNAPSGATGTYVFDNLRAVAANNAEFSLAANPAAVAVTQGASAPSTIGITRVGGFAAGVAFTASGLPAGVTATFNPATTTGASTVVTFAAAAGATTGAATVTITGTGGGLSRTAFVNLTVNAAPTFTLSANPAALTVARGATAQSTVAIARQGGFAAGVAFTASGLPAGVTAAFNPATTTGASTVVTFTASAAATLGTATVTITGTGGGLTRTTTVGLTVTPPADFTLAAVPAAVTVVLESSAPSTINITRLNGFAGAVSFGAAGLPVGVTATFNPASATGNSTVVTFATSPAAVPGTTSVTITGAGGGITRTVTIQLTVVAPAGDFAITADPSSLTIAQGQAGQVAIGVVRFRGFPSAVSFTVSGMQNGVTPTFSPPATTGDGTTLTFAASATADTGGATVMVTATGGGKIRTLILALFVTAAPAGDFAISADSTAITVAQGGQAQSLISISRFGFTGAVSFSVFGVGPDVAVTFSPPSTTGDSTMVTFAASPTAALAGATVTLTGTSGGLVRSQIVSLFVAAAPAGDFAISADPTAIMVAQGGQAQSLISISRFGFTGAVSFSVFGVGPDVAVTFSPPSTTGDSTMVTFAASPTAALGGATVTLTGTSGGLVRSQIVSLFVVAP